MKTVQLTNFGIDNLELVEKSQPQPTAEQVLVKIEAVSLNYVDLLVIKGLLNPSLSLPYTPITDSAGVVERVGDKVKAFKPGDKVVTTFIPYWVDGKPTPEKTDYQTRQGLGILPGQLSQYKCFDENRLIGIPHNLTILEAATLPIAGLTAWNALNYSNLTSKDTVLLHGTGGVSIFALQFAKAKGSRAIVTSSSEEKLSKARELGADLTIDYKNTPDWEITVRQMTQGKGIDVIVETVGGSNLRRSLDVLKMGGHISVVGLLDGFESKINVLSLIHQQATIRGMEVGGTHQFKAMNREIESQNLRPIIDRVFSLEQTKEALTYLESGSHFGKVIIAL